jgi:hypothetical protein
MDFSLDHSVAVRQRQTGKNSRFIPFDAADHSLEFTDLAVSHILQPGIKPFAFAMTKHTHKVLSQFIDGIGCATRLADSCEFSLLGLVQIGTITRSLKEWFRVSRAKQRGYQMVSPIYTGSALKQFLPRFPFSDRKSINAVSSRLSGFCGFPTSVIRRSMHSNPAFS